MFDNIAKKYFPSLIKLVQDVFADRDNLFCTGLLHKDDRTDTNVIVSVFHQKALVMRSELENEGIYLIDSDSSNVKFFLSIPEYNCRIRFGKMDQHCHMAKKNMQTDRDFANQQIEFPDYYKELRLHLGYTLAEDGFSLDDIILAKPKTIDVNMETAKLSELEQKTLFTSSTGKDKPAAGTILEKLQRAEERKNQKTI